MAPLVCPLCCNQTFLSHDSLKTHLLGLIDNLENLSCPSCKEKCEDLLELCLHLGRNCVNLNKIDGQESENKKKNVENQQKSKEKVKGAMDMNKSKKTNKKTHLESDPEMVYTCEMCNMSFPSIEEHLAKFHEGEEVILETEETVETESQEEDNSSAEDDNIFNDMHCLRDAEMTDYSKYKIEAGQTTNDDLSATTTKYVVKNGFAEAISDKEADSIDDKTRIIQTHNCANCNLQFPNLTHFKRHNCSNVKKFTDKKFKKVERTKLSKIKEDLRYQCTFCEAVYTTLIALNDHSKSHLVDDDSGLIQKKTITMSLHSCNICNTEFPTSKQLKLHARMHDVIKVKEVDPPTGYTVLGPPTENNDQGENNEQDYFECSVCGKTFNKEYETAHMSSHDDSEQFICLVCNRKFDSKESLTLHTKAHSTTKKFPCSYCKKPFLNYTSLENHVKNKCQKRDFACQYCGRRFGKANEKVKHERIHTGEKPHVCDVCGKAFRVGFCLTLHMRTHTGKRPYSCDHCGKCFKSYSVFNHHLKTHSDVRNYKCPFCPKAFKTAVQLAGHKNSHTKPFSCTECNRPFAALYAVRAHMETHKRANNLRHECNVCGAIYARPFALRDHVKEVHGQDIDKIEDEQTAMEIETDGNHHVEDIEEDENAPKEEIVEEVIVSEEEICQVVEEQQAEGDHDNYELHIQENETVE